MASRPLISAASRSAGRCLERRGGFGGSGAGSSRASSHSPSASRAPVPVPVRTTTARSGSGASGSAAATRCAERKCASVASARSNQSAGAAPDEASITVTRVTDTAPGGSRRASLRGAEPSVTTTTSRTSSPAYRRTT